ncbi:winged helix-turn-helix transcriptional regulator (plasmid) [Agrobacterium radiobacter]|uniref:Transcriptional regulator, HxlR family (Modular protein) n=1 Tax=Agrobacterium tumefaciens str. B6 TaxID=1183423 RepID=A0A822VCY7_AGRTU|nr:helix-turn-helix domain-containing protein [Agrobacterium tumefaciens]MQB27830.1 transcriptional regulator [Agrobacterium tumefaciens]NTA08396.1 helix-turn-helix transcriptional regulator [Agrobacterium tumefaciens]NTB16218.1 helix-turn-helix transcriptional regulator [Agrobacterium tumefaciens]CVI25261.1 Transcriptional regulator, HxlR family (modular protein) [Agrobacterium tumefaciens str. B6]SPZ49597.1 MarR family transcriptional regulator [Agrobacterium tumefaciens]
MAKETYNCPVEATVDVAGGKWKPVIIYHLLDGPKRFGELRRMTGDPSQRSITMQLRQLEGDGIVNREVFAEVPPRVEYSLTEFGKTLWPVLRAMKEWGDSFMERSGSQLPHAERSEILVPSDAVVLGHVVAADDTSV